eukprot:gene3585-4466_t
MAKQNHISYPHDNICEQCELKNENDDLLDEKGVLKKKGWSRTPCLKYNPLNLTRFKRAYRLKEWNYYSLGSNQFYFAVAAIDLGYVVNYQTFFIDFTDGSQVLKDEIISTKMISKGLCLPNDSCFLGTHTEYRSKNFKIHFHVDQDQQDQGFKHQIKVTSEKMGLDADLVFDLNPSRESIVLVTPIGKQNFYYNRKTNLIPVSGTLKIDGSDQLDGKNNEIFGIMDWGRGIWDYSSFWLWSSAWGKTADGRAIGLNFGSGFGDLSTHTENGINVDGTIHKLGHVDIKYNEKDLLEPWNFICKHGRFNNKPLVFTPFRKKLDNNNFGVVMSNFHQILGKFNGELVLDDNEIIPIDIYGFAEVHSARW